MKESRSAFSFPEKSKVDLYYTQGLRKKLHLRVLKTEELSACPQNHVSPAADEKDKEKHYQFSKKMNESNDNINANGASLSTYIQNNLSNNDSKILKIKNKNEKNFKDLNKSLANLASRRLTGRSSSDNDAKFNAVNIQPIHQESYPEIDSNNSECLTAMNVTSNTPFNPIKGNKVFQTSVQKYFDQTPSTYYENRKFLNSNNYITSNKPTSDISLSDLYYDKFQRGPLGNKTINQEKFKKLSCYTESNTPLESKLINPRDFTMNFSTNTHRNISQCTSLYSHSELETNKEFKTKQSNKNLYMPEYINQINDVKSNIGYMQCNGNGSDAIINKVKSYSMQKFSPKMNNSTFTPGFKTNMPRQTNYIYSLQDHIDKHTKSKLDNNQQKRFPLKRPNSIQTSKISLHEGQGKLELDKINDGVEYTQGGLGINSSKKINKSILIKQKTGEIEDDHDCANINQNIQQGTKEEESRKSNKDVLYFLKRDIIKIKKDIENRKKSYNEVNKLVRLYEHDLNEKQDYSNSSEKSLIDQNQRYQRTSSVYNVRQQELNLVINNSTKNNNSYLTTANTPRTNHHNITVSQIKLEKYDPDSKEPLNMSINNIQNQELIKSIYKSKKKNLKKDHPMNPSIDSSINNNKDNKIDISAIETYYDFNNILPSNHFKQDSFIYNPSKYSAKKSSCCDYDNNICTIF